MVVCKFFLQGNCRFGANCRYEHTYRSQYSYINPKASSTPVPSNPSYQNRPTPVVSQTNDANDQLVLQAVHKDVKEAINGKQWLVSCYAPFKTSNVPVMGFNDFSFEEFRCVYYQCLKTGNEAEIARNLLKIQEKVQHAKQAYESLLTPSPELVQVLLALYRGERVVNPGFNSPNHQSPHVQQRLVKPSFSFVNPNNSAQQSPQQFVSTTNPTQPISNLAPAPVTFNFVSPQQTYAPQTTAIAPVSFSFTRPSATNVTNQGSFGNNPSQNAPTNAFGGMIQSFNPTNPGNNAFGVAQNVQYQASSNDFTVYSDKNDLDDDDLLAYQSDKFICGLIPENPPSKDLCM